MIRHDCCIIFTFIIRLSVLQISVDVDPVSEGWHTCVDGGTLDVTYRTSAGSDANEQPAAILIANSWTTGIALKCDKVTNTSRPEHSQQQFPCYTLNGLACIHIKWAVLNCATKMVMISRDISRWAPGSQCRVWVNLKNMCKLGWYLTTANTMKQEHCWGILLFCQYKWSNPGVYW